MSSVAWLAVQSTWAAGIAFIAHQVRRPWSSITGFNAGGIGSQLQLHLIAAHSVVLYFITRHQSGYLQTYARCPSTYNTLTCQQDDPACFGMLVHVSLARFCSGMVDPPAHTDVPGSQDIKPAP